MLDQFLVSYGMLHGENPVWVNRDSVAVFRLARMVGSSKQPTQLNRPYAKSGVNTAGIPDHFPILVQADIRRPCTPVEKIQRTRRLKRSLKHREAIELVIGHLKSDDFLGCNYLKGEICDQMNVLLRCTGHNLRLVSKRLRFFVSNFRVIWL